MEAYFKTGFSILSVNLFVVYDESLKNQFQQRGAEMLGGGERFKTKLFYASVNQKTIFYRSHHLSPISPS
jgi:hypothetical protein